MSKNKVQSKIVTAYSWLLDLYPEDYRQLFGNDMLQTFLDQCRDEQINLRFLVRTFLDEIINICRQNFYSLTRKDYFMKKYLPALTISLIMVIGIVLTNVVFPQYGHDDYPFVGLMYLTYFASFAITGYLAVKKTGNVSDGAKSGAIIGLSVMLIMCITYFIIDNAFIDIVSKQQEKIDFFTQGGFKTMRESINYGLLKGLAFGSVIGTLFGALFGTIGAYFGKSNFSKKLLGN